jgi:hypothetical protein
MDFGLERRLCLRDGIVKELVFVTVSCAESNCCGVYGRERKSLSGPS